MPVNEACTIPNDNEGVTISMTEKEAIWTALKTRGYTQKMLAEACGYSRQSSFTSLMSTKSMSVNNFVKMLNVLGYDVIVKDRNGNKRDSLWLIEREVAGTGETV